MRVPSPVAPATAPLSQVYLDHVLRTVDELREEVEVQRAAKDHAVNIAIERAAAIVANADDLMSKQDIADRIRALKGSA